MTGFSVLPTGYRAAYVKLGKTVFINIRQQVNGTSNSTAFTISLPFPCAATENIATTAIVTDNGVGKAGAVLLNGATNVNIMSIYTDINAAGFVASGSKKVNGLQLFYESAT